MATKKELEVEVEVKLPEEGEVEVEVKVPEKVEVEVEVKVPEGEPEVVIERTAPLAGAKAVAPEDVMKAAAPKMKKVVTGKHVITGEDIVKEVAVPYVKDYSAGRKLFPVHTAVKGSYNGRRINLVAGEEVYLNPEELAIFRMYVSGAGK